MFQKRIVIGDETWVSQYEPETKPQILQWKQQNMRQRRMCQWETQSSTSYSAFL